jgi:hypothetical protein
MGITCAAYAAGVGVDLADHVGDSWANKKPPREVGVRVISSSARQHVALISKRAAYIASNEESLRP